MTLWVALGALAGTVLAVLTIVRENRAQKATDAHWVDRYLDRIERGR